MPTLSYFYGIYIKMYFQRKEHNPPHFHAIYGEYTGEIEIKTLKQIEGDLPPKAMELIKEWGGTPQRRTAKNLGYTRVYKNFSVGIREV